MHISTRTTKTWRAKKKKRKEKLYSHAYAYSRFPNSQVLEGYRDPRPLVPPLFRRLGRARAPLVRWVGPPIALATLGKSKGALHARTRRRQQLPQRGKAVPMALWQGR